jgi:hypothetical protein
MAAAIPQLSPNTIQVGSTTYAGRSRAVNDNIEFITCDFDANRDRRGCDCQQHRLPKESAAHHYYSCKKG